MKLKKLMSLLMATVLILSIFAGCSGGKEKKKIVIYTSMYEDVIEAIDGTLEKKFPDYDIEFFYGGTGALQAKIAAELDTKALGCDMLMVAEPSYSLELKDLGILHPYLSPEAENLGFDYDAEGYWYPVRISNMVLAYNPEKFSSDEVPHTFKDFAYDTSLKGMISMSNPLTSGTALASISGLEDKYGPEYFAALGSQNVMVESGSVALTKLETGECKTIMILEESVLKKREEEGSPLTVIYPEDGTIMIPSTIMTVNDDWSPNKNTDVAAEITDWFLSKEGQDSIVSAWMHSPREDYPNPPFDAIPTSDIRSTAISVDWERTFREREAIRTKFEEKVKIESK